MPEQTRGIAATPLPSLGLRQIAFAVLCCFGLCTRLTAEPLVAADDTVNTLTNTPVTIPVLLNDRGGESNQLAILNLKTPSHGTATINSIGAPMNAVLSNLFQFAAGKLSNSVVQVGSTNSFPRSTLTNGTWKLSPASDWISGFFPGALWYEYEQTGEPRFRSWAENWTAGISSEQYDTSTFDQGFMINNSFGAGYRLTGYASYKPVVIQAANSAVAGCYNAAVGCLGLVQSKTTFEVIMDATVDLELLFNAAALSGDSSLYTKALGHLQVAMLNQIRADGSVWSQVIYNPETGAVVSKGNRSIPADHTWSRGLAWGTYGFTMGYRETGDRRFLNAAQRLADYYVANVPPDYVPYWDYQASDIPYAPKDSSAAAITLSAMLELSQTTTNFPDGARYWAEARNIFDSLRSTNYLALRSTSGGILLHGTGEGPTDPFPEIDVSLIYGDYYFIEALRRYAETYRQRTLTYVPNPGFQGTDTFAYQVCDSGGNCSTAMVTVVVEPASPSPLTAHISLAPETQFPTISFPTTAGRHYRLEYQDGLSPGAPWELLVINLAGSGSSMSVTDTNFASYRFYRVGIEPFPPEP